MNTQLAAILERRAPSAGKVGSVPKKRGTSYVKRKYAGKRNYIKFKWKLDKTLEN